MYFSPRKLKFLLNIYPPYLGAGIGVTHISDDWKSLTVVLKKRWYNRNAVGTHFGGNLYSMADPHLMLMLMQLLGRDYIIWDQKASIEYIKAGRTHVTANISISDADILLIKEKTSNGEKYLPEFTIEIENEAGELVAKVRKVLYVRKKQSKNRHKP